MHLRTGGVEAGRVIGLRQDLGLPENPAGPHVQGGHRAGECAAGIGRVDGGGFFQGADRNEELIAAQDRTTGQDRHRVSLHRFALPQHLARLGVIGAHHPAGKPDEARPSAGGEARFHHHRRGPGHRTVDGPVDAAGPGIQRIEPPAAVGDKQPVPHDGGLASATHGKRPLELQPLDGGTGQFRMTLVAGGRAVDALTGPVGQSGPDRGMGGAGLFRSQERQRDGRAPLEHLGLSAAGVCGGLAGRHQIAGYRRDLVR